MNKKRCINCNCKFHPNKHVVKQKYCKKRECQNARKANWRQDKLRHNKKYLINKKEAQNKWRISKPDYWRNYRANILSAKSGPIKIKKSIIKISLPKNILVDLHKARAIKGDYRVVLAFT